MSTFFRLSSPVGFSMLLLLGCGPSEDELNQRIDARIALVLEQKLVEHKVIKSEQERQKEEDEEAAKPEWLRSMEFLATLEELMRGYQPVLPDQVDNTDMLRCATELELNTDRELKDGARSLKNQAEASRRASEKQRRDFERSKWIQYRIDYACPPSRCMQRYEERVIEAQPPAVEAIGLYSRLPVSQPDALAPPELMKRIETSGVNIPERFTCRVREARMRKDQVMLECVGNQPDNTHIRVTHTGSLREMVHRGDIVSVPIASTTAFTSEYGTILKEVIYINGSRERIWIVEAKAASLRIDAPAECPTNDEILEAAKGE